MKKIVLKSTALIALLVAFLILQNLKNQSAVKANLLDTNLSNQIESSCKKVVDICSIGNFRWSMKSKYTHVKDKYENELFIEIQNTCSIEKELLEISGNFNLLNAKFSNQAMKTIIQSKLEKQVHDSASDEVYLILFKYSIN